MLPSSAANRTGLVRALGPWMATAVVVGTTIGSGVFLKPHEIARQVSYFGLVALAWVLGGLLVLLGSLAYAEIAVLFPQAGGNYVFLKEGYGRLAGFLWGWVEFGIIRGASLAALATAFTTSLHDVLCEAASCPPHGLLGPWQERGLTVVVILGLALVNVRGVRWGGALQLAVTILKGVSLIVILLLPLLLPLLTAGTDSAAPRVANLMPTWPETWDMELVAGFGAGLVGCLWAYHGWMNVAWLAEEVKRPQRNLPLALFAGVGIIIFLYLGANLAYALVLPQAELARLKELTVVAAFGRALLGPAGLAAASAVLMCSVFGSLSGNLLAGPRLLYAMGEDGLAPRALGAVHPRYRTPAWAILLLAGWACGLVLAVGILEAWDWLPSEQSAFDLLTNYVIFGAACFETLAVSTIFVFRRRLPNAARPYRCLGYPLVPALYLFLMVLVLANMFFKQRTEALTGLAFIVVGVGVYQLLPARTRSA
jgi:APA family basic amino acid/polyamine antiporter